MMMTEQELTTLLLKKERWAADIGEAFEVFRYIFKIWCHKLEEQLNNSDDDLN